MGQVLIRNLDDSLIEDYRRSAADKGRSLEAELRDALASARPKRGLSIEELRARVHALWAATPPEARKIDSTPLIREARDAD